MCSIDIIVIAYNEEKRIIATLNSITNQDYEGKYRIIFVNDGSKDKTLKLVEDFARSSKANIKIISFKENKGRGAARQSGITASDADYIAFCDADIILPFNWLTHLLKELIELRLDGVSMAAIPDGDVAVISRIFGCPTKVLPGSSGITGNNVIFKREVFQKFGFNVNSTLGEDFRLAYTMEREGYKLKTIVDYQVKHIEAKSYKKALKWLYYSGVDATSLLIEFKKFRNPDLAWFFFIFTLFLAPLNLILGIFATVITVLFISFAHTFTRFKLSGGWRFLLTFIADIPLITLYLIGRTVGLFRLNNIEKNS
jgi:glycosyltransferase involved in cell wall biosynthesis